MLTRLALYSHIPFQQWANEPAQVVMTALDLIEQEAKERRREEARAYARSRR